MDVSAIGASGLASEVQGKAASGEKQPLPPPPQEDTVEISEDAKTLASKSVLDE